jgi:potassium-dependent mechanosensitive channel
MTIFRRPIIRPAILAAAILAAAAVCAPWLAPAASAQAPQDAGAATVAVEAALPQPFEIVTRARAVLDSAAQVERTIARLGAMAPIETELVEAGRRVEELQALLATLADADYVRPERVSRQRDQAVLEDQRLEGLLERTIDRLTQLGAIRAEWLDRGRFWQRWRTALQAEPDFALVAPELERAEVRIAEVLERLGVVLPQVVAVQRRVEELRIEVGESAASADALRAGRRAALLHRGEPVLLSAEHRSQLTRATWQEWRPLEVIRPRAYLAFFRDTAGALAMLVLLGVIVALLARRLHRVAGPEGAWSGLLRHPWAVGTLIAAVLAMQRVALAPPLWDVVLWTLFAAAAARLTDRLFAQPALRWTIYLFAAVYPLFILLEAAALPAPLFRVGLAAVAAAALPVFLIVARRGATEVTWPLRIGALMWAAVLVAVALGYDLLGRWVLHATVTSGAVVFTVVFMLGLARGAIATLLRVEAEGRFRFLRTVGAPLAQRIVVLLQFVLVIVAALVLLDVWELAASPITTWRRIVETGFDLGPVRMTIGRLMFGGFVIYFALLLSWLVRAIVQSEVYRRWDLDRGVGDSINMIVHYTLITVGTFVALGVLGVELQNFAIVAGALGIGIGFGLQNVVNNFVSGLILLFERPVRVGDTVVVADEWGTIQKIGLRSTVMLTFDQSEMIVPNADLVSEKVTNWTLSSTGARLIMTVGVAYGSSIAQVLAILRESGFAHPAVLTDPPPVALFTAFGDSSLDFELRVWVSEIRLRLEVRSAVLTEIERRFSEAGIGIPFPQRDLHVRTIEPAAAEALGRARS